MYQEKIKRAIAKEGLILIGLSLALYFSLALLKNVPVVLPRYRLEFVNGEVCTIDINPELNNNSNYGRLLEEVYSPSPRLVEKRIKEFVKAGNIKSALKSAHWINSRQIYISKLYSRLLGVTFIYKLAFVYLILLLLRFIFWSVRILSRRK